MSLGKIWPTTVRAMHTSIRFVLWRSWQGRKQRTHQHNSVRHPEISGAKILHSPSIQCSPEEEATRDSRSGTETQPDNLQNRGHVLRIFENCFESFCQYSINEEALQLNLTPHTDSFLQSAALLGQFDGMNVSERSLVAEHFAVDGSHHELLHLPLWKDMNT